MLATLAIFPNPIIFWRDFSLPFLIAHGLINSQQIQEGLDCFRVTFLVVRVYNDFGPIGCPIGVTPLKPLSPAALQIGF
jgi:hypothetical protein